MHDSSLKIGVKFKYNKLAAVSYIHNNNLLSTTNRVSRY